MDATTTTIIVAICSALAIAGIGYVFFGQAIAGHDRTSRRVSALSGQSQRGNRRNSPLEAVAQRRKQVAVQLKELEDQQKQKKPKVTLRVKLLGAGLNMTPRAYYIGSVVFAVVVTVVVFLFVSSIFIALAAGFAAGFGVPRWFLNFMTQKRQKAFVHEFANALDIIVRGVKSGLPVNECLKVIANESPAPVGPEFAEVVDSQRLGVPLDQALERLYERVPVAEVNFFQIVLSIQQKTGGNLAETLGNLARVLRDRKKMKAKVQAMSSEAKTSALIIGSLPFAIMSILYFTSHDYVMLLFTERFGQFLLIVSACWMSVGVYVMHKMINFDF